jgi:hypothetical protein
LSFRANINQILDTLPNLPISDTKKYNIQRLIRTKERFQFEAISSWSRRFSAPSDNQSTYAAYSSNPEALLALAINYPRDKKRELLIHTIQHGIDIAGAFRIGVSGYMEGGHGTHLVSVLAVTSKLLDDPGLRSISRQKKGEKGHTFIGPTGLALWGQNCPNSAYFKNKCVLNNYQGGPKDCRDPGGLVDELNKPAGISSCLDYQNLNGPYYAGQALAMRLLNAMSDFNHQAFFDYTDRWMRIKGQTKSPFVSEAWRLYR